MRSISLMMATKFLLKIITSVKLKMNMKKLERCNSWKNCRTWIKKPNKTAHGTFYNSRIYWFLWMKLMRNYIFISYPIFDFTSLVCMYSLETEKGYWIFSTYLTFIFFFQSRVYRLNMTFCRNECNFSKIVWAIV